jgi:hypothetical protein
MRANSTALAIAGTAILFYGCASTASTGLSNLPAAHIERGVTTEQDLIQQLGEPQGRGLDAEGRKMLTWNRMNVTSTGKAWIPVAGPFLPGSADVKKEQLAVSFNAEGHVVDYRVTKEQHGANIFGETD